MNTKSNSRVKRKYHKKKKSLAYWESKTPFASSYRKALWILEQYKKGYTLTQIGKAMNVSRQRVYQTIAVTKLKEEISRIYQKRIAQKRSSEIKNKILKCLWCGKKFWKKINWGKRLYCSPLHKRYMHNYRNRIKRKSIIRDKT